MRNLFTSIFLLLAVFVSAQKVITKEITTTFDKKQANAFQVNISYTKFDDVEKALEDFFKNKNAKYKPKKGFAKVEEVTILEIENTPITVYAKLDKVGDEQSNLIMAFEGLGGFLSSTENATVAANAQKVMYNFAYSLTKKGLTKHIEEETKLNADLLKDKEKLVKEKSSLTEEIEKAKKVIEESGKELEKVNAELESQNAKVEKSTTTLSTLKSKMAEI